MGGERVDDIFLIEKDFVEYLKMLVEFCAVLGEF